MRRPRTAAAWCDALSDAIDQLFDVKADQQWQLDQLRRIVAEIGDSAMVGGAPGGGGALARRPSAACLPIGSRASRDAPTSSEAASPSAP